MNEPASSDTRNVVDEFRGMSVEDIKASLDTRRNKVQIAIENLERDFNMGTIVRNANAFNVSDIHIVGKKQWNKRGAMVTDKYMNIHYHGTIDAFMQSVEGYPIIGVDNVDGSLPLMTSTLPENSVLVFGSEGPGLSKDMIAQCDYVVAIEQFGSTRSVNVGVASGIVLYRWLQLHVL